MCYWGYGVFKLKPVELYDLEPVELFEMVQAHVEYQNNTFDMEMNKLAWQTSIILNGMGTLKKKIKPTDLYNPEADTNAPNGVKIVGEEEHNRLQAELLDAFKS